MVSSCFSLGPPLQESPQIHVALRCRWWIGRTALLFFCFTTPVFLSQAAYLSGIKPKAPEQRCFGLF